MSLGGGKHTYLSAQTEWERSVMRNFFLANPSAETPDCIRDGAAYTSNCVIMYKTNNGRS